MLVTTKRDDTSKLQFGQFASHLQNALPCRKVKSSSHSAQKDAKTLGIEVADLVAYLFIANVVVFAMACKRNCYVFIVVHGIKDNDFGLNFALCVSEILIKF